MQPVIPVLMELSDSVKEEEPLSGYFIYIGLSPDQVLSDMLYIQIQALPPCTTILLMLMGMWPSIMKASVTPNSPVLLHQLPLVLTQHLKIQLFYFASGDNVTEKSTEFQFPGLMGSNVNNLHLVSKTV